MNAEEAIRKTIRGMLKRREWKKIAPYVDSMKKAWPIWKEEEEKSKLKWPLPTDQGMFTKEELSTQNRLLLRRRLKVDLGVGSEKAAVMTADTMATILAAAGIEKPPIPSPPRPTPPYEKRMTALLDYLAELSYWTYHINSDRYKTDCILTYQAIKELCEEYDLNLEEALWDRDWEAADTAREMFEKNTHFDVFEKIKSGQPYSEMLHPLWANQVSGHSGYWEINWEEEYYSHFRSPVQGMTYCDDCYDDCMNGEL